MELSDFLQRQLDLLGRILGKALTDLLGIKNKSQIIEEFESINQIITNELKISLNVLIELKKEAFLEIITNNPKFNLTNIEKLATLFFEMARKQNDAHSNSYFNKSLYLFEHVNLKNQTYSSEREKIIAEIKASIHLN